MSGKMKAMILAAGLGTRLRPLTDKKPKALVEVEGVPMLERVILELKAQGFNYLVVNVHHFASQIKEFLKSHNYGVEIKISDESHQILDTGGGIVKAFPLLFEKDDSPLLIHNVDIISNADLKGLYAENSGNLLLVSDRKSSRKLIFNRAMELKGWHDTAGNRFRPDNLNLNKELEGGELIEFAFSGIYKLSKEAVLEMKDLMGEERFPIMDYFLNPDRKVKIKGKNAECLELIDMGKPATLAQASELICKLR